MNDNFVIEKKWDLSVGLFLIDNTQKLIRHFEYIGSQTEDITIDLYENGMVTVNLKMRNNHSVTKTRIFSINITNGDKISDAYIKMIESIYKPYCERINTNATEFKRRFEVEYDENNPDHIKWFGEPNYTNPLILISMYGVPNTIYFDKRKLIDQTFEMLKNLKNLYYNEKISKIKYIYEHEKGKYDKHSSSVENTEQVDNIILWI